ncbi:MAG: hypothetical protein ACLFTZ_02330, partial [Acholeplasmataceae bacterium]
LDHVIEAGQPGVIRFNYVDVSERITDETILLTVSFTRKELGSSTISLDVIDLIDLDSDNVLHDAEYTIIEYTIE